MQHPLWVFPQLDKLSAPWILSLPGPETGLTTPIFREAMVSRLCAPSPICASRMGQTVMGPGSPLINPLRDSVNCSQKIMGDSQRTKHNSCKNAIMDVALWSKIPCVAEIFGFLVTWYQLKQLEQVVSLKMSGAASKRTQTFALDSLHRQMDMEMQKMKGGQLTHLQKLKDVMLVSVVTHKGVNMVGKKQSIGGQGESRANTSQSWECLIANSIIPQEKRQDPPSRDIGPSPTFRAMSLVALVKPVETSTSW